MPSPLKKQDEFDYLNQEIDSEPKFQDFQNLSSQKTKLDELLFFARIAFFSMVTVFFAFVLLAMHLAPLWAFLFSSLLSYGTTLAISKIIHSFLS
ncbi:DUF3270 domain-containing protein [Streptococcus porcinus]|uniref:DUF3270 family protein n=1 Tax=Streptococcus porcinus str. Jelinkova 176 TaxID=873448 RepID=A0ABN0CU17_STRPO|nr:DUF3270 domain-containing protein [Streptococcus porcinus]EGJ26786.1 hypothetical protein STRPO_0716 [Streptococcus porcinus str. Jelinkova 176]SQG44714.1 membrane protein [Streptococcus porcinus]